MNRSLTDQPAVAAPEGSGPAGWDRWHRLHQRRRRADPLLVGGIALVAAVVVLTGRLDAYVVAVIYFGALYAALGQSWNIIGGLLGYISLGQIAIFGFGAYLAVVTANLTGNVVAVAAVLVAGSLFIGVVCALPALRVGGIVFAFTSLFLLEIVRQAIILGRPLTGGLQGLYSTMFLSNEHAAALMILVVGASVLVVRLLAVSRLGRAAGAVRADQAAAEAVGVRPTRVKLILFAVSGLVAGLAGGIHALYLGAIFPTTIFAVQMTFLALALPVIGGLRTAAGPVVAGVLYAVLQEVFQVTASNFVLILIGVAILLTTRLMPDGLVPAVGRNVRRLARYRPRRGEGAVR